MLGSCIATAFRLETTQDVHRGMKRFQQAKCILEFQRLDVIDCLPLVISSAEHNLYLMDSEQRNNRASTFTHCLSFCMIIYYMGRAMPVSNSQKAVKHPTKSQLPASIS
jgi:hypothetical protein